MLKADIAVAGGGPAGLVAAALFAQQGRKVVLISGAQPSGHDPRTVALMQPSVRLLAHLGIWPGDLKERVSPLKRLRMVDDTQGRFQAPTLTFNAAEIGEQEFGWNFPLAILVPALAARARELGVTFVDADVTAANPGSETVGLKTAAGTVDARLAVAADGRHSALREAAGIRVRRWAYPQAALATSFDHSGWHQGISTEYHKSSGPFTTVPLPGNRSALVWMERPERAAELLALPDNELSTEIQLASHGDLGRVSGIGPRRVFPMEGQIADSFARKRTLLVGETAHVVPPIGAQGLNMSFRDAAQAAELIEGIDDPGADESLEDYSALRRRDVLPRQQVIDGMNRSLLSHDGLLAAGRAFGLEILSTVGPLRRAMMRRGLGPVHTLPRMMQDQGSTLALMA
ncbi:FAD-dependent monooxygenase [Aestuariivirga sp.]|uniref:FAD-dependent monooxygenase n=1 Tax=Aestuariivirga sp. TaxID=2650926 RepID=UPI0039E273D6